MIQSPPKKRFHKINIEISNICNLQCSFCPEVIREKGLMSIELFTRIIDQAAPLTEQVCLHLMGDPLVHPKLNELIDICHQKAVRIFLVTNGVLLSREGRIDTLLHPAIRQVCFSLHSFHDNFGTERDPTDYLERVFRFTERAFAERPDLYINYRLWNLADPRGLGEKNNSMLQRVHDHFEFSVRPDLDVRRQKSIRIKNRLYLHFDTEFTWPALDLPVLGTQGKCHGLSNHFGILMNGTVVPCCLDKEGVIPIGNVQEKTLIQILDSPRAKAMTKGFRERRLIEDLCQRCQYIDRYGRA